MEEVVVAGVLEQGYDFVVCGAGTSGSVVARRLAEIPDVSVLLVEAGGTDEVDSVRQADQWPLNLGTERDWGFAAEPDERVHGRALPFSMGKGLGGGSSINLMIWSRGHRSDWDHFAAESGEKSWGYERVLDLYRSIEDWHGTGESSHRGRDGLIFVQPVADVHPVAPAVLEAAKLLGIPTYQSPNGRLMEELRGAAITDMRIRDGQRVSVFRSYVGPYLDNPNLTVLTDALVTRVMFEGTRATGVEIDYAGSTHRVAAGTEVVLSLGAIHTPKVLMQSGVGDMAELRRVGIPVVQHLPGIGRNFQDHFGFDCVWGLPEAIPGGSQVQAALFWDSGLTADITGPDLFAYLGPFPKATPENAAEHGLPKNAWTLFGAPTHPKSRGQLRLTGPRPTDPIRIHANALADPEDLKTAIVCVETLREIGNSAKLRPFVTREAMPGNSSADELETYLRNAVTTYWHQSGTAKMGRDPMSVVDGQLNVYGVSNLRIADASIMPRITTANTMAPCVIVGERAAHFIRTEYKI
jgi:choline dehydrogenase